MLSQWYTISYSCGSRIWPAGRRCAHDIPLKGKWEGFSSLQNFQKWEWWDFLAVGGLIVTWDVGWKMRAKRQGNMGAAVGRWKFCVLLRGSEMHWNEKNRWRVNEMKRMQSDGWLWIVSKAALWWPWGPSNHRKLLIVLGVRNERPNIQTERRSSVMECEEEEALNEMYCSNKASGKAIKYLWKLKLVLGEA